MTSARRQPEARRARAGVGQPDTTAFPKGQRKPARSCQDHPTAPPRTCPTMACPWACPAARPASKRALHRARRASPRRPRHPHAPVRASPGRSSPHPGQLPRPRRPQLPLPVERDAAAAPVAVAPPRKSPPGRPAQQGPGGSQRPGSGRDPRESWVRLRHAPSRTDGSATRACEVAGSHVTEARAFRARPVEGRSCRKGVWTLWSRRLGTVAGVVLADRNFHGKVWSVPAPVPARAGHRRPAAPTPDRAGVVQRTRIRIVPAAAAGRARPALDRLLGAVRRPRTSR